jgi:hypothetical protein
MQHKRNVLKRPAASLLAMLLAAVVLASFRMENKAPEIVRVSSFGKQPTCATDRAGNLHVVFGQGTEIFYSMSSDGGSTFSSPQKVGEQNKLSLGTTRGPQIISTRDYAVIAAPDHTGRIMVYRLKHGEKQWSKGVNILGTDSTAKEGFVAIGAGPDNDVYAAWLDLRIGQHNNLFGASSRDGGKTWSVSKLIYKSPDGSICPCCRPSLTADAKGNVYVMFRNDVDGARDMYLARSHDGAKTFSRAEKLGMDTWKLDRCPMDGGAVSLDAKGQIGTTWIRDKFVFYAEPGKPEQKIAEGRSPALVKTAKGEYLAWQDGDEIVILTPGEIGSKTIGTGIYPRLTSMPDGRVICVWESAGSILARKL